MKQYIENNGMNWRISYAILYIEKYYIYELTDTGKLF